MIPSARCFVLAMGAAALLAPPAQSQVSNRFPLLPSHAFEEGGAIGRFVDNGLEIRASRPVSRFPFGRPIAAAARVDVSTVLREGPVNASFGLAFNRRPDGTPWLRFLISANGLYSLIGSDGTAHIAWRASPAIRQGAGMRNDLAFDIQGRTLRLYINGTAVEQWGAPADLSGEFGYDVNDAAEIRFDRQIVIETQTPPAAADFVLEAADSFRNNLGTGRFLDGGLEIRAGEQGVNKYPFLRDPADPSRFEVSAVLRDGLISRGFGIVVSPDTTGERDTYFLITGNGQYKFRVAGTDVIPWQPAAAIRQGLGQRNDLAIELRGTAARLFVNGIMINEWSGSSTVMGRLGLSVLRDLEVRFDRTRYLPLPAGGTAVMAPPPPAPAAPRPRGFVLQPGMAISDSFATERVVDGAFEIIARRNVVSTPFADTVGTTARIEVRTTILRDTVMVSRSESGQELFTRRSYGVMFSGPDTLTRVQFLINGFGEYSLQLANRILVVPWTTNAAIRRGEFAQNVLAIEVLGRTATLYINGTRVNAWTAPRDLVGTIGFIAGQNQHIRFDNISVQSSPGR